MSLRDLTPHDWLQIEQAAAGCISGTIAEWPHLRAAFVKVACDPLNDAPAWWCRTMAKQLLEMREKTTPPAPERAP